MSLEEMAEFARVMDALYRERGGREEEKVKKRISILTTHLEKIKRTARTIAKSCPANRREVRNLLRFLEGKDLEDDNEK